jgi:hypothetical protein
MKKILCLLVMANFLSASHSFEKFIQKNAHNKSQEIALRIGCAFGMWAALSFGVELNYYVATLLRKANHVVLDNSLSSAQRFWEIATLEPVVIQGKPQTQDSTIINVAKMIGYGVLAALPIGVCYLAIS